jgi:hypothetical protein
VNPIFAAALEVQAFCTTQRFGFCFIGGLAVQRWGEPRLTVDVDLTLLTGFGAEASFVDTLLARFRPRRADARDFALRYRVLLLESSRAIPLDVSLGAMPFEERTVARASGFEVGEGAVLSTCSAEDLIVHKAFADRAKDWLDIEGIAARQARRLDEALIWAELRPLLELKGAPEIEQRLQTLLRAARTGADC